MSEPVLVLTAAAEQADAERIAATVVSKRLAACVQVSGPIESTYWWNGQIETTQEWRLSMKTVRRLLPQLEAAIRELHSYSEPEFIAVPIVDGSQTYLRWLEETLAAGAPAATTGASS